MKTLSSKITVLVWVSTSVHDNVWKLWLFVGEFPLAAMLNTSLLCMSFAKLVAFKIFVTRELKNVHKIKKRSKNKNT